MDLRHALTRNEASQGSSPIGILDRLRYARSEAEARLARITAVIESLPPNPGPDDAEAIIKAL